MPRGGRRPGAGARKGNLNALKTGEYSKQIAKIFEQIPDKSFILLTKKGGLRLAQRKDHE